MTFTSLQYLVLRMVLAKVYPRARRKNERHAKRLKSSNLYGTSNIIIGLRLIGLRTRTAVDEDRKDSD